MLSIIAQLSKRPFLDLFRGLERCLESGPRGLVLLMAGLILGWWIYVPIHELLHAFACLAFGGEVTRLEIDAIYGGTLFASLFPFVVSGSEYAGRLSGFDTLGNDLIYLATDLGPFLLTLMPGVLALRSAASRGRSFLFGASLPFAMAPFISLSGDAYEIGSILVTRIQPWSSGNLLALLRSDDFFRTLSQVNAVGGAVPWCGLVLAALLGAFWAWVTYLAGGWIASRFGQGIAACELDSSYRTEGLRRAIARSNFMFH